MNVKQAYFDFLQERGAKEKVQEIIRKGINEWKKAQAWYYDADDNDPGDCSGRCHMNGGKAIGDIAKTDIEVLKAYTGVSEATYASGCGLRWLRVADSITSDIDECLTDLKGEFILTNAVALFDEYDIEHDDSWSDGDTLFAIDEAMIVNFSASLNYEWMRKEFPEYENDDFEKWHTDYLFNVRD